MTFIILVDRKGMEVNNFKYIILYTIVKHYFNFSRSRMLLACCFDQDHASLTTDGPHAPGQNLQRELAAVSSS